MPLAVCSLSVHLELRRKYKEDYRKVGKGKAGTGFQDRQSVSSLEGGYFEREEFQRCVNLGAQKEGTGS